ncbi:MAG: hypothetical protein M1503_03035 [Thaumarchaeota archaeon]|nr:hypothetical protein [Nitrososphaerota archaeon]MCL5317226.1 hypothetical protein [Nitrososphaerota archaeon]
MGLKDIVLSSILFVLLVFTSSFLTANVSALGGGPPTPLRPEWIKAGDYVTYLESITTRGLTGTILMRVTIQDDSGVYLNKMRIERFEPHIPPNFPSGFGLLDPDVAENTMDGTFMTLDEKVATYNPEIELVHGLNNKTYEAYRLTGDQLDFPPCTDCNLIVWYEKNTLIKVRQLQWHHDENGMNVTTEQIIEDSNIQGLASASSTSNNATLTTPAKTVTTTVFVRSPQTIVTTTVTITATTTVTGYKTVETTTVTETRSSSENTTVAIPVSAGILAAGAIVSIVLLKKRAR